MALSLVYVMNVCYNIHMYVYMNVCKCINKYTFYMMTTVLPIEQVEDHHQYRQTCTGIRIYIPYITKQPPSSLLLTHQTRQNPFVMAGVSHILLSPTLCAIAGSRKSQNSNTCECV